MLAQSLPVCANPRHRFAESLVYRYIHGCSRIGQGMSGLLALLDDVAAIAKVAAASIDDVAAAAAKAGTKAAGVVIDDAAVTPKYVHGFSADRELPIIRRIALGSLKNKLIILLGDHAAAHAGRGLSLFRGGRKAGSRPCAPC
jgi:hypothetical protein